MGWRWINQGVICGMLLCCAACGRTQLLQRVEHAPALKPLPLTVSGRAETLSEGESTLYRSQWPGTVYTAAFQGTAVYFHVGTNHEILHVLLDGRDLVHIEKPSPGLYRIGKLSAGRHTIRVQVATESQDAPNDFGGFGIPAKERALPAPPASARQIEFIGDSHTVGYGNTSPKQVCTPDEVWVATDTTQNFGALVAQHYGADYQINAISGRGIVRNYNGIAAPTLPEAYPYVLFDKKQPYHDAAWHPEVLVLALGTNDFSTPLHAGETWASRDDLHTAYEARYLKFLEQLHAANPHAYILLWATGMANGEIEAEVSKVAAQARAEGIVRLSYVPFDTLHMDGCHGHPSLADDKAIALRLEETIDAQAGIWEGQ